MVPIKNSIICLIIALNATGIILNFVFINKRSSNSKSFFSKGSRVKNNDFNFSYKNEDNFNLSKINGNENISKENIKSLRKLTRYEDDAKIYIIILTVFSLYFTVSLIFTFNIENPKENQKAQENQAAQTNQTDQIIQIDQTNQTNQINQADQTNQRNNARKNGGGGVVICCGDAKAFGVFGLVIAVALLIFLIVLLLSKLYTYMGRKNSAYCSLIFLSLIHLGISIICFSLIHSNNTYVIGGISSGLFIFNFLTILIPNLNCQKKQENNDIENIDAINPILLPENDYNSILIRDKPSTPIINEEDNSKMNEPEAPVGNINVIDVFERNNEKYDQSFDDKNESFNNQNEPIGQASYCRNSDLSNAPFPGDNDLSVEDELYKNYSNL